MKKIILALLATIALSGPALGHDDTDEKEFLNLAKDYVCIVIHRERTDLTCDDGVLLPQIIVSWVITDHWLSAKGYVRGLTYPGEPYIFIRPGLDAQQFVDAVTHELTHFIVQQLDPGISACDSEEMARVAVPDDVEWRQFYGCEEVE